MDAKPYHHGDLRQALLAAAEDELIETGIEGFSLRKVARRAGVSHAAPTHHFRDARGLLTALASVGFRRFVEAQKRRQALAAPDPISQQAAAGLGYIDFAEEHTALFRLMFGSRLPNHADPDHCAASMAAFDYLAEGVAAITGSSAMADPATLVDVSATWAIAHGLADLLSSGRLSSIGALEGQARDDVLTGIISRVLPRHSR